MQKLTRAEGFLIAATLFLVAANLVWIGIDTRPPFFDTAYHQSAALRILDHFSSHGIQAFGSAARISGNYPPLYYFVVALFYAIFGRTVDAAQWANLPALILLAFATYGIARRWLDRSAAALAAVLVNFFPFMLWISRETVIEYWLVALVASSILALLHTEEFSRTRSSLIFGVICGLGMLVKWTFAMYVWLPALWYGRRNPKNALAAAGVTCLISACWYVPRAGTLKYTWQLAAAGGRSEGDPSVLSWQSVVFYVRTLEGCQLFLPLFALFIAGIILVLVRARRERWMPLLLWLIGGWMALVLIGNKDPRYSAPLLPAVAIICAAPLNKRRTAIAVLFAFLVFQHHLVSFGVPSLPERVVLARGVNGPMSWHWNLYTQTYFDLWGKPLRQDWQIDRVLKEISASHDGTVQNGTVQNGTVRLGIIPDIPRFDSHAFEFFINLRRYPVVINKLWAFDQPAFYQNDYIIFSENDQGFLSFSSSEGARINAFVADHPQHLRVVDRFELPGMQRIRLYKVDPSLVVSK